MSTYNVCEQITTHLWCAVLILIIRKQLRDGCAHYCQPILSTSSCLMLGVVQNSAGYKLYFMPFHNPPLLSNPKNISVTVLVLHVPADFVIRVTIHFQSGFFTGSPSSKYVVYVTAYEYRELYGKITDRKKNCVNNYLN